MPKSVLIPALLALLAACATEKPKPDYARPLPPGRSALRKLGPGDVIPDPGAAWRQRDAGLVEALDASLRWFEAPSSRRYFPFENIVTHEEAKASVAEFRRILTESRSEEEFRRAFFAEFDVWQSVGWDGSGTVLFTGYYSPEFPASRERTARFRYPLYRRPADLVTDPLTGEPRGREMPDGSLSPYPTRREIQAGHLLDGQELVWLEDPLSAYICHVNGSARLILPDGTRMTVGYAGKTDRPYRGLGQALVREGLVPADRLGLPAVRAAYHAHPDRVLDLMNENESFVFFREYDDEKWPAGSLGVKVHAKATLATDKSIYPRGGVVLVSTSAITTTHGREAFLRFLLDQDTGGAIQAPGRADIFMGIGPRAETLAGGQYAEGTLYYVLLRHDI